MGKRHCAKYVPNLPCCVVTSGGGNWWWSDRPSWHKNSVFHCGLKNAQRNNRRQCCGAGDELFWLELDPKFWVGCGSKWQKTSKNVPLVYFPSFTSFCFKIFLFSNFENHCFKIYTVNTHHCLLSTLHSPIYPQPFLSLRKIPTCSLKKLRARFSKMPGTWELKKRNAPAVSGCFHLFSNSHKWLKWKNWILRMENNI